MRKTIYLSSFEIYEKRVLGEGWWVPPNILIDNAAFKTAHTRAPEVNVTIA